jgi:hypothetical protein
VKTENQDDALREVRRYIGMDNPADEALRKERAQQAAQVAATIQARRRELEDIRASKTRVGRLAESMLREGFANAALFFQYARTERKIISDLNALTGEREHIEYESTLIEYWSRWLAGQIKQLTNKLDGFGLLKFRLSTTMLNPDTPLIRERK